MFKLIRWFFIAVLAVVVVIGGALFFLPGDRIARIAADQIRAQTGREVVFSGETQVTWWPILGVRTGPVVVANADWSKNGPMFRAEALTIGVEAATLFGGDVRVTEVIAARPEILLERNEKGAANWEFGSKPATGTEPAATSAGAGRGVRLEVLRITDGALHILDAQAGTRQSFAGVSLSLDWPDAAGPATLSALVEPAGKAVRLTGEVADLNGLMAGKVSAMNLRVSTSGGAIRFDGRGGTAPEAQGRIAADLTDTRAFLSALGVGPVDIPAGLGRAATLGGEVTLTGGGALALRDGTARLDGNEIRVAADAQLDAVPTIKARIDAGSLDLSALMAASGSSGGQGGTAPAGWSTAPIDASALGALNGEVAFNADRVVAGDLAFGPVQTVTRIDRARAVTDIARIGGFGGTLSGQFVINNRSGLSTGGTLSAADVDLQQLLSTLAGISRFTGTGKAEAEFLASGPSVAALMNSLQGKGRIDTGRGSIAGIDLDRLFRSGEGMGGTTIFDSIAATFRMEGGNLLNNDLDMRLASITAKGEGRIGLGAQDLDYLFTPISLKARDGRGIAIPIRIKGPWSKPRILPDLEKAIELNAAEERKALEEKAKQKVEEKVTETLGIEKKEGESTEDAVKRKIEEEALKGLGKLLGGN